MRIHYTRCGSFSQELCKYLTEIAEAMKGGGVQDEVQMSAHWGTWAIYYSRALTRLFVWHVKNTFLRIDRCRRRLLLPTESVFIFEPKRLCTTSIILYTYYMHRTNEWARRRFSRTPWSLLFISSHPNINLVYLRVLQLRKR